MTLWLVSGSGNCFSSFFCISPSVLFCSSRSRVVSDAESRGDGDVGDSASKTASSPSGSDTTSMLSSASFGVVSSPSPSLFCFRSINGRIGTKMSAAESKSSCDIHISRSLSIVPFPERMHRGYWMVNLWWILVVQLTKARKNSRAPSISRFRLGVRVFVLSGDVSMEKCDLSSSVSICCNNQFSGNSVGLVFQILNSSFKQVGIGGASMRMSLSHSNVESVRFWSTLRFSTSVPK
mmetsp:Transcript_20808/g.57804  ORF Transcript_20808/g.57804 Transcript_20808/m.57804 type:complete len:236 (-) Transcript_20808:622-1329(-)